jgi:hypothetical protein
MLKQDRALAHESNRGVKLRRGGDELSRRTPPPAVDVSDAALARRSTARAGVEERHSRCLRPGRPSAMFSSGK